VLVLKCLNVREFSSLPTSFSFLKFNRFGGESSFNFIFGPYAPRYDHFFFRYLPPDARLRPHRKMIVEFYSDSRGCPVDGREEGC